MKYWDKLTNWQQALALGVTIVMIGWGANAQWNKVDNRITKNTIIAGAFKKFKVQYDLRGLRRRLWRLEDRYGKDGCPTAPVVVKQECQALWETIAELINKDKNGEKR